MALRVFLSHTSELRRFPASGSYIAATGERLSAGGDVIVDMADFPAIDETPAAVCKERVRGCAVVRGHLRHALRLAGEGPAGGVLHRAGIQRRLRCGHSLGGWCSCWMRRRRTPAFRPNG